MNRRRDSSEGGRGGWDGREIASVILEISGITKILGLFLNSPRLRGPLLRAVNYHGTPASYKDNLYRHFQFYKKFFTVLGEGEVSSFLHGEPAMDRPGLMLTFDDGLKSHYTVAAPLLDAHGLKGFFFLPVKFIELGEESMEAARAFFLDAICPGADGIRCREEDRIPMSWEDAKDLVRRGHAMGCHGLTHRELSAGLADERLYEEIVQSKRIMEKRINTSVSSFCWPIGRPSSYSNAADELIRRHYQLAFTTFASPLRQNGDPYSIDRSNVEAHMSLSRVKCAVGGITEIVFRSRRRHFENLIHAAGDVRDGRNGDLSQPTVR